MRNGSWPGWISLEYKSQYSRERVWGVTAKEDVGKRGYGKKVIEGVMVIGYWDLNELSPSSMVDSFEVSKNIGLMFT